MKKLIFIFLFIASISFLNAQNKIKVRELELGNIISDSSSISLEDITKKLNLSPITQSSNVIEIRLYSNIGFKGTQCTIFQYTTKWKTLKCKLNDKDSLIKKVNLKSAIALDKIAQLLIVHNVFSLPTQDDIKTENYKFNQTTGQIMLSQINVSDAPCYYLQFKVGNKFRQYKYCAPSSYAAFYKTKHEYADFNEIVKLFSGLK